MSLENGTKKYIMKKIILFVILLSVSVSGVGCGFSELITIDQMQYKDEKKRNRFDQVTDIRNVKGASTIQEVGSKIVYASAEGLCIYDPASGNTELFFEYKDIRSLYVDDEDVYFSKGNQIWKTSFAGDGRQAVAGIDDAALRENGVSNGEEFLAHDNKLYLWNDENTLLRYDFSEKSMTPFLENVKDCIFLGDYAFCIWAGEWSDSLVRINLKTGKQETLFPSDDIQKSGEEGIRLAGLVCANGRVYYATDGEHRIYRWNAAGEDDLIESLDVQKEEKRFFMFGGKCGLFYGLEDEKTGEIYKYDALKDRYSSVLKIGALSVAPFAVYDDMLFYYIHDEEMMKRRQLEFEE